MQEVFIVPLHAPPQVFINVFLLGYYVHAQLLVQHSQSHSQTKKKQKLLELDIMCTLTLTVKALTRHTF